MSVEAVRLKQNITCYAWQPDKPKAKKGHLIFQTNMWRKTGPRRGHSREVSVLRRARLAVWAHDYVFLSPTRTSTTLVFAAPNGTIEGGSTSTDVPGESKQFVSHISTIACNVDLEFIDDILTIGNYPSHGDRTVPINTLRDIMVTQPNSTVDKTIRYDPENNTEDTLNELALWMTVAPITNGVSVEGTQPLYDYKRNELPVHVTTPASGGPNDKWDFSYIENFISVSIGASAIGDSSSWSIGDDHKVNITSHLSQPKLDPSRPLVLIIPPAIILLSAIVLLMCNLRLYRQARLPIMRLATLSEILKSSQTTSLREAAVSEMQRPDNPSGLEQLVIKFEGLGNGLWGLEAYNEHQRLLGEQELYSRNPSTITTDTLGYEGYSH
ncbi:hypothetical protein SLS60_004410 [Paraconiothyrium brasiliense]|uniref:Uncharacterized protein n=1 Tax=Paraconiothyrium brasiliense TaxID=300254 RepID=A0ABR3RKA2_9PLEO